MDCICFRQSKEAFYDKTSVYHENISQKSNEILNAIKKFLLLIFTGDFKRILYFSHCCIDQDFLWMKDINENLVLWWSNWQIIGKYQTLTFLPPKLEVQLILLHKHRIKKYLKLNILEFTCSLKNSHYSLHVINEMFKEGCIVYYCLLV